MPGEGGLTAPLNPAAPRTAKAPLATSTTSWLWQLGRTDPSYAALVLRLTLAIVMFPHGAQKLLGWFGGLGFSGTMAALTETNGLPAVVAFLVIVIEFFGSIGLALGFLSRIAAAGIAAVMIGAVLTTHVQVGFFMNWFGNQTGEGFEYHLLALGIALAVMIEGSGAISLDRMLSDRR